MPYNFNPPAAREPTEHKVQLVPAIILFRNATGESLANTKHFIETNLIDDGGYSLVKLGELIRAYYGKE